MIIRSSLFFYTTVSVSCATHLPLTTLFDSCLIRRFFLTFSACWSSDSQLTSWRGPSKGQSRPRGSSKKHSTRFCTPMHHFSFHHSRGKYRERRQECRLIEQQWRGPFRLQHYREICPSRHCFFWYWRYWQFACLLCSTARNSYILARAHRFIYSSLKTSRIILLIFPL